MKAMERIARMIEEKAAGGVKSRESSPTLTPPISAIEAVADAVFANPGVVPEEYAAAKASDVPQVLAVDVNAGGRGACFFGNAGIGKTYAATALARRLVTTLPIRLLPGYERWVYVSKPLLWTSAPYLLARIRDTFRKKGGMSEKDIIDECIAVSVFLLDDLGAEKQTEFTGSTLYTILSERRNRRRYTIVTTNQRLEQIAEWEPRIASRLAEMTHIALPNRDRRLSTRPER